MLAPLETLTELQARVNELVDRLPWQRASGLASLILELPGPPASIPADIGPLFHLEHTHRRELRAGFGVAWQGRAEQLGDTATWRDSARRVLRDWWRIDVDDSGFDVFAWLGMAAAQQARVGIAGAGVPAALLWVPQLAVHCCKGQCVLILTADLAAGRSRALAGWMSSLARVVPALAVPTPGPLRSARLRVEDGLPDRQGWERLVQDALRAIAERRLEKVVLARRLRLSSERRFDVSRLAAALGYLFPACQMLRWQLDRSTFVAATPERLIGLRAQRVETDALAGTAGRAAEAARDTELAAALLASPKECREHELVVADIVRALTPLSRSLDVPSAPQLLQLNNAQHLWSPITATLEGQQDLLTLAERLHPTPAVNGTPRAAARDWLAQHEPFARGWYTGAAGWIGPDLGGELWVLLRCALLQDYEAHLYAGAGLVAGSEPDSEWQETEDKLAAMLTALQFV